MLMGRTPEFPVGETQDRIGWIGLAALTLGALTTTPAVGLDWKPDSGARLGPSCVTALAYCVEEQCLYAVDGATDQLAKIDQESGVLTRVGRLGFPVVTALAFDRYGVLFGIDGQHDQLLRIDRSSGKATAVGKLGFESVQSLASGPQGELFGVDTVTDQLIQIETHTGEAHAIGKVAAPAVFGMTRGPDNLLYAVDMSLGQLISIDASTAIVKPIGDVGSMSAVSGLGTMPNGQLVAFEYEQNGIFCLDHRSGATLPIVKLNRSLWRTWIAALIPSHIVTRWTFSFALITGLLAACIRLKREVDAQWERLRDEISWRPASEPFGFATRNRPRAGILGDTA